VNTKIIPMSGARRSGESALDEFLPERIFAQGPDTPGVHLDPSEVHLEPIKAYPSAVPQRPAQDTSTIQVWPMLAAALVAFGVSLLTFAALTKFVHL
jgi:hypothetical protein